MMHEVSSTLAYTSQLIAVPSLLLMLSSRAVTSSICSLANMLTMSCTLTLLHPWSQRTLWAIRANTQAPHAHALHAMWLV